MGVSEPVLATSACAQEEVQVTVAAERRAASPAPLRTLAAAATARPVARTIRRERRTFAALVAADAIAVAVAAAVAIRVGGGAAGWLAVVPVVLLLARLHGLYGRDPLLLHRLTLDETPQVVQVVTLTTLGLWLVVDGADRTGVVAFAGALLLSMLVARHGARRLVARALPVERCLFVGAATDYERLAGKLAARGVHAQLTGRLAVADDGGATAAADVVALEDLIGETRAHRVVIDAHALAPRDLVEVVRAAERRGLRVSVLSPLLEGTGAALTVEELDGLAVVGVRRFGLPRSARAAKRAFDVTVTMLGLLLAGPLMVVIALAIVLDSGGPVLFRQARIGRGGRVFHIMKFRTMDPDADARRMDLRREHGLEAELFKLERDPRVTRVGRVLRACSLDELPQLLNVLRGEMSLVGPRPLVLDEDARITGADRRRLHLTPGMTGNWQIAACGHVPLSDMVKIDASYIAGWSLWLDVKILLRTVPHVLGRRGM